MSKKETGYETIIAEVLRELKEDPAYKFKLVFSVISVIPLLAFFYIALTVSPEKRLFTPQASIVLFLAIFISVCGFIWGYQVVSNLFKKVILYAAKIKSLQNQLQENYKRLEELSKLKDFLSATISHDINNLFFVIRAFLETANEERDKLPEMTKKELEVALKASEELLSLISDFVDIKKIEDNKLMLIFEETDINELIRNITGQMAIVAANSGVKLEGAKTDKEFRFKMDKKLISRVLVNLIINSIKSTPAGGNVSVGAAIEGNGLKVSVKDTGAGVPPEYREKIFEKFVSVDNKVIGAKKGKGIGLTFCRFVIEAHGGKIWVESEVGKGSEFIFALPNKV